MGNQVHFYTLEEAVEAGIPYQEQSEFACDRVHASRNSRAMQASRLHERYPEHRGRGKTRTGFHPAIE